jgi:hypothetical protein
VTEPLLALPTFEEYRNGDPARLLEVGAQEVRSRCGWHIAPEITETVTVEGLGAALLLPTLHLTGITSIFRDDVGIPLDHVTWKPNGIVTGYSFGAGDYVVTFTHGHAECPPELIPVIADVGQRRVQQESLGSRSVTFASSEDVRYAATLDRYTIQARP